jgi:hypothetical protein
MENKKIKPIDILERRKLFLNAYSELIEISIEDNFEYLQANIKPLVANSIKETIADHLPPFVQNLFHIGKAKDIKSYHSRDSPSYLSRLSGIADIALGLTPAFSKGFKGIILSILLSKIKNILFKKKVKA